MYNRLGRFQVVRNHHRPIPVFALLFPGLGSTDFSCDGAPERSQEVNVDWRLLPVLCSHAPRPFTPSSLPAGRPSSGYCCLAFLLRTSPRPACLPQV